MNFVQLLWSDETGSILTAETVLLGTVAVVGATVGIHKMADAVNAELSEVGGALRALDQSYSFKGFKSCRAETAGSTYTQPERDECESHRRHEEHKRHEHKRHEDRRDGDKRDDDKKPRHEDRREDHKKDDDKKPRHEDHKKDDDKKPHHEDHKKDGDKRDDDKKPEPRSPRRPA